MQPAAVPTKPVISIGTIDSTFVYCVGPHMLANFMSGPTMYLPYAICVAVTTVYAITHE